MTLIKFQVDDIRRTVRRYAQEHAKVDPDGTLSWFNTPAENQALLDLTVMVYGAMVMAHISRLYPHIDQNERLTW